MDNTRKNEGISLLTPEMAPVDARPLTEEEKERYGKIDAEEEENRWLERCIQCGIYIDKKEACSWCGCMTPECAGWNEKEYVKYLRVEQSGGYDEYIARKSRT
jgi:hypothetical protein